MHSTTDPQTTRQARAEASYDQYVFRFSPTQPGVILCSNPDGQTYGVTGNGCSCPDHQKRLRNLSEPVLCIHRLMAGMWMERTTADPQTPVEEAAWTLTDDGEWTTEELDAWEQARNEDSEKRAAYLKRRATDFPTD